MTMNDPLSDEGGALDLSEFAPLTKRLSKDHKEAAISLSANEAAYLVDQYYEMQHLRIAAANRLRRAAIVGTPNALLEGVRIQFQTLEDFVKAGLHAYTLAHPVGRWARQNKGIGPVLAAGLIAYIRIQDCQHVSAIWHFAGLTPGQKRVRGVKLNYNPSLKTLCWKIGESFVKVSGSEEPNYGHFYLQRKAYETARNENGLYAAQAAAELASKKYSPDTEVYKALIQGKLSKAHIHARSKRWAVKLFLSHLHEVWWEFETRTPAIPAYVQGKLGHTDYEPPLIPRIIPKIPDDRSFAPVY